MNHQTFAALLGNYGEFVGAIAVVATLVFLGLQIRTSNKLALAESQREMRHIWQENMFYLGQHSSEFRELLYQFDGMQADRQLKAAHGLIAMGNQVDTLLKMQASGLETEDSVRYLLDAFSGMMSTPGGLQFWQRMTEANMFGDDLLQAVDARLRGRPQQPDKSIAESLEWLRFDPDEVSKAQDAP